MRPLGWAGHVARMELSGNAQRVLVGKPEGRLDRPRSRCEVNINFHLVRSAWLFLCSHLISLSKFNLPLIGNFTWPTPPGPYRATTCRGRELNYGSHTYFFDHTRTWRASPDEWSALCRGHLRDSTNMKDNTNQAHTQSSQQGEYDYDGQMIFGDLGGLKFPDIYLICEEKPRKKTSPRKLVSTGDRTRARCVTGTYATSVSQRWTLGDAIISLY